MVPTALLVSAIEQSALAGNAARDDEFYLGVLHDDGELWQLHRILTGGPLRGTMTLDSETALGEGTCVQVCRTHHLLLEHTQRIHMAFPPSNDESRYCGSPTEGYPRIRRFATGAACGGGFHGARGLFCCGERECIHAETLRRGNVDVHRTYRTWCTGVPRLVSPTPSRRATPQGLNGGTPSTILEYDWRGMWDLPLPGPIDPGHSGSKLFL